VGFFKTPAKGGVCAGEVWGRGGGHLVVVLRLPQSLSLGRRPESHARAVDRALWRIYAKPLRTAAGLWGLGLTCWPRLGSLSPFAPWRGCGRGVPGWFLSLVA